MNEYRVTLDTYNGPLDLLLFLIRREEVDIHDIPIAGITEQYIEYVDVLKQLDPEAAGDFLVLAATLMEIKSRMLLPKAPPEEADEDIADPRLELVRQLLEYKKYKDAARSLEASAAEQALKHARFPVLPPRDTDEIELDNIEIWDLFDAFNRLLEQTGKRQEVHEVTVDDTPMLLHAEDIVDSLERTSWMQKFEDVFTGRTRAEMIGLFLAMLELIRRRCIRVSQDRLFGPILIHLLDASRLGKVDEDDYGMIEEEPLGGQDSPSPVSTAHEADLVESDGEDQASMDSAVLVGDAHPTQPVGSAHVAVCDEHDEHDGTSDDAVSDGVNTFEDDPPMIEDHLNTGITESSHETE